MRLSRSEPSVDSPLDRPVGPAVGGGGGGGGGGGSVVVVGAGAGAAGAGACFLEMERVLTNVDSPVYSSPGVAAVGFAVFAGGGVLLGRPKRLFESCRLGRPAMNLPARTQFQVCRAQQKTKHEPKMMSR